MDGRTDRHTDEQHEYSIPPQTQFAGGIITVRNETSEYLG